MQPARTSRRSRRSKSALNGAGFSLSIPHKEWHLEEGYELRIGVGDNETVLVWLIEGTAEIFGTELKKVPSNLPTKASQNRSNRRDSRNRNRNAPTTTQLDLKTAYEFRNCNFAIYACESRGCELIVAGNPIYDYPSNETSMTAYINYNMSLENMRRASDVAQIEAQCEAKLPEKPSIPANSHSACDEVFEQNMTTFGPRVLILGPQNAGKATLSKILASYSVRSGHRPVMVDLDCSLNMISLPGTVAAISVNEPINPEIGFNYTNAVKKNANAPRPSTTDVSGTNDKTKDGNNTTTGQLSSLVSGVRGIDEENRKPEHTNLQRPMVSFYGYEHPQKKPQMYTKCIENLALCVKQRLIRSLEARSSGCIIKCHSWLSNVHDPDSKILIHSIIDLFHINVIFILDDELLHNHLKSFYHIRTQTPGVAVRSFDHTTQGNNTMSSAASAASSSSSAMSASTTAPKQSNSDQLLSKFRRPTAYRIAIEKAPKSGGTKQRTQTQRNIVRRNIIRSYFYGPYCDYRPLSCEVNQNTVRIYSIGREKTQSALLPEGEQSVVEKFSVTPVRMDGSLRGQILAILQVDDGLESIPNSYKYGRMVGSSSAAYNTLAMQLEQLAEFEPDPQQIRDSNVLGFVHVTEVPKASQETLTLLSTGVSNVLPSKCMLKGDVTWHDM